MTHCKLTGFLSGFIALALTTGMLSGCSSADDFLDRVFVDPQPSTVDVSPLVQLAGEHIDRVREVAQGFQDHDEVTGFVEETVEVDYLTGHYQFQWGGDLVKVRVLIYDSDDRAKEVGGLNSWRHGVNDGYSYTDIINDNNTEAVLVDSMKNSYLSKNSEVPLPKAPRYVDSDVRVGPAVFSIREIIGKRDLNNTLTTQFIATLVEQLMETE